MKTGEMIRELRRLEDKHKNDFTGTCENNWSAMCHDVADRLEEQKREIAELNYTIEALKANKELSEVMQIIKDKKLLKEVYTTPKEFAECIDTIFSNNVDKIAHYFGVKADRDNISVDMLMEWLIEDGTNYADFIGFVDSFYKKQN